MSLHWYACISMNTYCYEIYHISLEIVWWALSNTSLIVWIHLVVHEILANKDFTVTDDLISQLFVVTFVHPTYVQISLIWGFTVQLSLWKSVHWLWRYKLNEVCDTMTCLWEGSLVVMLICGLGLLLPLMIFWACSIFLFWRLGNAFLIFKVFLAMFDMLELDKTCV